MIRYSDWSPTGYDTKGFGLPDRQDWAVSSISRNRDSSVVDESNWHVQETQLAEVDPDGTDHEVHRFGHWACGWFEVVLIRPGSDCHWIAEGLKTALANHPILDEHDHSEREQAEADEVWKHCYSPAERIAYIKRYRSQFEFCDWADLLGCVRGNYFAGYAGELVNR